MQSAVLKFVWLLALTSALGFSAVAQTPTFICQCSLKTGTTGGEPFTPKICAPEK